MLFAHQSDKRWHSDDSDNDSANGSASKRKIEKLFLKGANFHFERDKTKIISMQIVRQNWINRKCLTMRRRRRMREEERKKRMNDGKKNFSHTISQPKHPPNAFRLAEKHQFMVVGIVDVSDDRQNVLHMFSANRRCEINIFNAYEINCISFYQISRDVEHVRALSWIYKFSIRHEMNWKWRHRYQCQSVVCRIVEQLVSWVEKNAAEVNLSKQSVLEFHLLCCRHSFPAGRIPSSPSDTTPFACRLIHTSCRFSYSQLRFTYYSSFLHKA